MFASKVESHSYQQPNPFIGVRFVLFGFNSTNEPQVRSKLVNGGGVYIGQYNQDCTHVIVDKLVYDDPVCVTARIDGKTLVTGLWVDHSFDIGMPVDHTSIMYRPLKDLNGILGAKNFIMCLTGYQRQDRDDIMTMVGLMGARFSKPLVANKVTHLICYKFEGEKYELAKKMKIKLVNHKWLEDCLSAWEILPEANYNKSGYELEMETEAKDSEEEAEDSTTMQFRGKSMNVSPYNIQTGISRVREMPTSVRKVSMPLDTTVSIGPSNVVINEDIPSIAGNEAGFGQVSSLNIINKKHPEVAQLPDRYDRTPVSTKVVNNLVSTSGRSKKSPHSDVRKITGASYKRKTPKKSTHQGEISSNLNNSSTVQLDELKISVGIEISPSKADQVMDKDASVKTPTKRSGLVHTDEFTVMLTPKRKTGVTCASSKSQKIGHDSIPSITRRSPSANNKIQGLESTPLSHSPGLAVNTNGVSLDEAAFLHVEERSPSDIYRTKSLSSNRKSLTRNLPLSETRTSEIGQDNNAEKAPATLSGRLKESTFCCKPATLDFDMGGSVHEVGGTGEFLEWQQTVGALSPSKKTSEFDKSHSPAHVDLLRGENAASLPKPVKSMGRKKSLGSKSKLGLSNTANRKGSIYLDETLSQNDTAETASHKKTSSANKLQVAPCFNGTEPVMEVKSNDVPKPGNDVENKMESMDDDDTEAPEEKNVHELEKAVHEKSELVEVSHKPDMMVEDILEGGQHIINDKASTDNAMALEEDKNGPDHGQAVDGKRIEGESISKMDAMALKEDKSGPDHAEAVDGNRIEDESTSKKDAVRRKTTKGKKRPFGKSKMNTVRTVTENIESERTVSGDETGTEKIIEKSKMEVVRGPQHSSKSHSNNVPADKLEDTIELEKENTPMIVENKRMDGNEQRVGKVAVKSSKTQMKANQKSRKVDPASVQIGGLQKRVKDEPMWFILSGHRLQRKEFQKMIRNLRGRVCRDSHQWSYQATHFIVPDPIRRTEKFFAAAASGRWILNTDYLTASNQAGKFLAEESYEWHKIGLSEDGAINLEAPKKWRLLREKTGHGAFYGMRIIIYGECIAPPLDTLKRAIKAGDGTILATSPPYTRFLTSGVDFAIVSPGMPRVDIWVQEFLRHEIPCVLADYLVEYVCKPGYSLEKHVQYNTHSWAEKSFANLLRRSEEIIEDLTPPLSKPEEIVEDFTTPVNHGMEDLTCQVCGSSNRGDVMLICGNETGSTGCGVGTHIDCCDPPLEEVPEENWFCPNCSRSKSSSTPPKSTKKNKTSKNK